MDAGCQEGDGSGHTSSPPLISWPDEEQAPAKADYLALRHGDLLPRAHADPKHAPQASAAFLRSHLGRPRHLEAHQLSGCTAESTGCLGRLDTPAASPFLRLRLGCGLPRRVLGPSRQGGRHRDWILKATKEIFTAMNRELQSREHQSPFKVHSKSITDRPTGPPSCDLLLHLIHTMTAEHVTSGSPAWPATTAGALPNGS